MKDKGKVLSGKMAEDAACEYLKGRGFRILGRNVRSGRGEIDIITRRGDVIAVVEVRSKKRWSSLPTSEIVGFKKRRKVVEVTKDVISSYRKPDDSIRFDVIVVSTDERDHIVDMNHIENAFSARGEIV